MDVSVHKVMQNTYSQKAWTGTFGIRIRNCFGARVEKTGVEGQAAGAGGHSL